MAVGVWLVPCDSTLVALRYAARAKRKPRTRGSTRMGTNIRILLDLLAYFNSGHNGRAVVDGTVAVEYSAV